MDGYIRMLFAGLLVDLVATILYLLDQRTRLGKTRYAVKQLIIGLIFGALAVFSTEHGVSVNGAIYNVRDAAALCAGLIFGAPAGILAGLIGGVERFFAVYWGAGMYTRWACTISTILAGFFGAWLRTKMFDNKKPTWGYALAAGLVMEVMHMLMIFLTNMQDIRQAFFFVEKLSLAMVLLNGLTVMLAVILVTLLSRDKPKKAAEHKPISQTFQRWLLICVLIAFTVTCVFTAVLQTGLSKSDSEDLLKLNIADVQADIEDASDANLLKLTKRVANDLSKRQNISDTYLRQLASDYSITEIDVVDRSGIITNSTNEAFVGYDMASGAQSAEFMTLLGTETAYVQSYQPISYDASISRKYAGVRLDTGGFVQVGYDSEQFQQDIAAQVIGATHNRHVGESGCVIICDENWAIVSDRMGNEGKNLDATGIWIDLETMPAGKAFETQVYGESSLCLYAVTEGYVIVSVLPLSEALFTRDVSTYVTAFMEILIFAALFMIIYFLIKTLVVENIQRVNRSLAQITSGNLDVTVNVRTNSEFASLSDDINRTVVTLKRYIAEAAARIDRELEFAKSIQLSALPSVFPPYPGRKDVDVYATMATAKEVGGDFYDFYFVGKNRLAFLIADVSGKGIPAAMFMMTAKTIIKGLAETGAGAAETLTRANEKLCENNDAGMFVTAWLGVIDLTTGIITYACAGHNPPLARLGDQPYEYVRCKAGFVLGGMEGVKYKEQTLALAPGDMLYLYTDGVTEATDLKERLYGEERLRSVLNAHRDATVNRLPALVKNDVDAFVGEAPQFDDMTMLVLGYFGVGGE